ncbi:hypothetical protein KFL_011370020 [Klebsormidium nitens]|uniref:Uncharacterized protein n=1 Tax=Klebsormidium nitens TaxID=105231 RepID=A0A1Y1IX00_KLENI|nr:hypothetical protein KFL_011370020 [Klebsormidium nitens]|eukprot:GAQ92788.1 hypothetical protein KFL_011370020 [Klebsormidium nitens]
MAAASEPQLVDLQVLLRWDEGWKMQHPSKRRLGLVDLASPSDRLHRLEAVAFWRLLQRAGGGEVLEEKEVKIREDIAEHILGLKEECLGNWQCSEQCNIRQYLSWPEKVPLNDPESFKKLGERGNVLRVRFIRSVFEQEAILGNAGPPMYPLQEIIRDGKGLQIFAAGLLTQNPIVAGQGVNALPAMGHAERVSERAPVRSEGCSISEGNVARYLRGSSAYPTMSNLLQSAPDKAPNLIPEDGANDVNMTTPGVVATSNSEQRDSEQEAPQQQPDVALRLEAPTFAGLGGPSQKRRRSEEEAMEVESRLENGGMELEAGGRNLGRSPPAESVSSVLQPGLPRMLSSGAECAIRPPSPLLTLYPQVDRHIVEKAVRRALERRVSDDPKDVILKHFNRFGERGPGGANKELQRILLSRDFAKVICKNDSRETEDQIVDLLWDCRDKSDKLDNTADLLEGYKPADCNRDAKARVYRIALGVLDAFHRPLLDLNTAVAQLDGDGGSELDPWEASVFDHGGLDFE